MKLPKEQILSRVDPTEKKGKKNGKVAENVQIHLNVSVVSMSIDIMCVQMS